VSGPLLDVRHLSTHYVSARGTRVTRAVDDVSLVLDQGQTLGIVGESGSGKTTLALTLLRLLPPAARIVSGEILFEGADLLKKSDGEIRRIRGKRIAMILQDPMMSLNPLFTVGDQVAEPIRVHEGASRGSAWSRATELLKAVRIAAPESRVREYPHQLSGGMRQRIVGAIAISCEPRILIADEPTTSLDLTIQAQYLNLLRELQRAHHVLAVGGQGQVPCRSTDSPGGVAGQRLVLEQLAAEFDLRRRRRRRRCFGRLRYAFAAAICAAVGAFAPFALSCHS